ncbi:MAG: class I SAM-dependent RNA methyltransferase [Anaerolineales bacterium]
MSVGQVHELTIEGMAYGGEGLGRADDGHLIFVGFCAPGERVRAREVESHKRWGRAELLEVLEASEARVHDPRCIHFGICGGCHYQHIDYQEQLAIKQDILIDQLQRLGGIEDPPVEETIPSPAPWNYRNRLRFHLREDGQLGFYRADGAEIFPLQECHLPEGPIGELWPQLELETVEGLEEVEVRVDSAGSPMVILHGHGAPDMHLEVESATSVLWVAPEGSLVLAGDPYSWMEVNGQSFRLSPGSFFQTNNAMTATLVDMAMEAAEPSQGQVVFDLYAGVGLFSLFLAEAGAQVIAAEESPAACGDFEVNLDAYDGISLYEAPVETALAAIQARPETILVDPPRSGLGKKVVQQILGFSPKRIVYVSCDPATLARDSKQLASAGYQLERVTPIDLFPQTYHLESLSLWLQAED